MDIKNLSYNELLLLADSNDFYNIVSDKQMLVEYITQLHKRYCKENNIKSTKIVFSDLLSENTYGCYDYGDHNIYINKKLLDIFEQCKKTNNSYYTYVLVSTIVHESRHLWQHINLKKMFDKDASDRDKITLYSVHKKKHEVKEALKEKTTTSKGLISIKDNINLIKNMFLGLEFQIEYGNSPCELDAEEEVLKAFMYIYENNLSENSLNILLNYANKIRENEGLWFLSHEYYEDKDTMYEKKAFEVIKSVYMNYLKISLEEHKKGNHSYSEEEHVFSLYPSINKVICAIKANGRKVPERTEDSKVITQLFSSSSRKMLPSKK